MDTLAESKISREDRKLELIFNVEDGLVTWDGDKQTEGSGHANILLDLKEVMKLKQVIERYLLRVGDKYE